MSGERQTTEHNFGKQMIAMRRARRRKRRNQILISKGIKVRKAMPKSLAVNASFFEATCSSRVSLNQTS